LNVVLGEIHVWFINIFARDNYETNETGCVRKAMFDHVTGTWKECMTIQITMTPENAAYVTYNITNNDE